MSASCQARYATDAERAEARRRTYRRSAKRRYYEYRAFCKSNGIQSRGNGKWQHHYSQIRRFPGWVWERPSHRFWLERFTVDEICELGGGLLLFAVDEDVEVAA